jgi:uncharacterized membrane protein HdeD (DUF308 family)
VPGEFYFMALGGLGVSLAGFAGLIVAFGRQGVHDPIQAWRLKQIVTGGFLLTHFGFGVIAAYLVTDDVDTTIRVVAGLLSIALAIRGVVSTRPGPAWPDEGRRRGYMGLGLISIGACITCAIAPSVGLLAVIGLLVFGEPVGVFVNAIADAARGPMSG